MTQSIKAITALFLALALSLAISACGQNGPLYLPGNPSEVQTPEEDTPESVPLADPVLIEDATDDEDEDDDDDSGEVKE